MKQLELTQRLMSVAKYIREGAVVADIGTDHGYIPVYLTQHDIARRIIATDIRKGPLARAVTSAKENGVGDRIVFVQTDGIDCLKEQGIDTVVIAGMGGETIAGILNRAPWTKTENMRLILQPQSKVSTLLFFLADSGYTIQDASLVLDDDRIYTVILAGAGNGRTPRDYYRILLDKREPLLPDYLEGLISKTRRAISGLERAAHRDGNEIEIKNRELEELMRLKEETDRWH